VRKLNKKTFQRYAGSADFLIRFEKMSFCIICALLLLHEMDAVYWNEWRLFGLSSDYPGRVIFIAVHFPLIAFLFYVTTNFEKRWACITGRFLALFLIVHFFLHVRVFRDGYFADPISFGVISIMVPFSIVYIVVSILRVRRVAG
jgi:hypothetical protein